MKKILFVIMQFVSIAAFSQSFYAIDTIQEIKIYFGFSNWDYRMDTAIAGLESYTPADSVLINGNLFLNCGVKFKGNSSYNATRSKNPLHIKLDYTLKQDYQGFEDLKLGNGFSDNSMIREPLSYGILKQYMDCPRANFAKVYINGAYYGIMNNAEDIGNNFLETHYYSSNHSFVKCNPQNAGPGSGNGSSLEYNGTTLSNYNTKYEVKSDSGWTDLIQLCDTLNNYYSSFNSIFDIDRALWMLAFNNALINLDSYSGSFRQNYYLYRNHAQQWIPTIWDLNMCLGGFSIAGGTTSNLTPTTMQTMNYLLHKTETAWPLINKLLTDPFYEKMYLAHLRTINEENFANASYKVAANSMHSLVDNAVQTDPNFLSTYSNFQVSLTTNTTGSGGGPSSTSPGIYPLMDGRASYLSNVLSAAYPVLSSPLATPAAVGSDVVVTVTCTNQLAVYLGYRFSKADRFKRIQMFDDGNHQDGSAGDNVFGATITISSPQTQYYFYAENSNTGAFLPVRAEHEFFTLNATINTASATDLVLNEITANNTTGIENEKGKKKDWIEIVNKSSQALSLNGWYLSDTLGNRTKWAFPSDAYIHPYEHFLVWADDEDLTILDPHTNFNLNNLGDAVYLSNGISVIDSVRFGNQIVDAAIARCPDKTGSFQPITARTPRAINDCNVGVNENKSSDWNLYPNPVSDLLILQTDEVISKMEVLNMNGEVVSQSKEKVISLKNLSEGVYIVKIQTGKQETISKRIIKM